MYLSASLLTYNGAAFIKKQLDSILMQTQKVDEIVICDDISTDETQNIINQYCNKFPNIIKFYINETNGGKVVIGPIAILAIGEVRDLGPSRKCVIFYDYR